MNLSNTNWLTMSSIDDDENDILNGLMDINLEQQISALLGIPQLDVVLTDRSSLLLSCVPDSQFQIIFATNGRYLLDHCPYIFTIESIADCQPVFKQTNAHFSFTNVDWELFCHEITTTPFTPYCYSNVDEQLKQWYDWIFQKIEKLVQKRTDHRSSLPPWVQPPTSHKPKQLNTLKLKAKRHPNHQTSAKIEQLQLEVNSMLFDDKDLFEEETFATRIFSAIYKDF